MENRPAREALDRIAPLFAAAIAREKAKQAKARKELRDE